MNTGVPSARTELRSDSVIVCGEPAASGPRPYRMPSVDTITSRAANDVSTPTLIFQSSPIGANAGSIARPGNEALAAGLNDLAWSAVVYLRFLRGRGSFTSLEKWQTDYLPVFGAWAVVVVILFPPLFRYI